MRIHQSCGGWRTARSDHVQVVSDNERLGRRRGAARARQPLVSIFFFLQRPTACRAACLSMASFKAATLSSVTITTEVGQTVQQHVSYEFIWIYRTCD